MPSLFKSRGSAEQPPAAASRLPQAPLSARGKPQATPPAPAQLVPARQQATAATPRGAAPGLSQLRLPSRASSGPVADACTPRGAPQQPPNSARGQPGPAALPRRTPEPPHQAAARDSTPAPPGGSTYRDALVACGASTPRRGSLPGPPPPLAGGRRPAQVAPQAAAGAQEGAAPPQRAQRWAEAQLAALQERRGELAQRQARVSAEQRQVEQHIRWVGDGGLGCCALLHLAHVLHAHLAQREPPAPGRRPRASCRPSSTPLCCC
jgi:hypothetical protein